MKRTPLNIGRQPQLFLDNWVIEMTHYATRTLHQPQRRPEPMIKADRPWEKVLYFRTNTWNVHLDPQENVFKCWYEDIAWDYEAFMGRQHGVSGSTTPVSLHDTMDSRYLYAQSADGIQWDKPELDHRRVDGRRTNICLGNEQVGKVHACTVLQDPIDQDPQKRYKALFWNERPDLWGRTVAAFSADGRSWRLYDEPVEIGEHQGHLTGDVIILTADPVSGLYHLDTRDRAMVERPLNPGNPYPGSWGFPQYPGDPWRITVRNISSTVSDNILTWPSMRQMLVPDDGDDNLDFEYYGMTRFRIGDLWLAFAVVARRVANTQEIHLIYSRDGFHWQRTGEHQPFMAPRGAGHWDAFMTETCSPPLLLDDEIRIYYAGANVHHDIWMFGEKEGVDHAEARSGWGGGNTALGLATLRPEGFVSIDTGIRDGILITCPFVSDGTRLLVNAACDEGGYLDVELVDADDDVVPGYERAACDTFSGDAPRHVVTWRGRSALPQAVLARGAKLRFWSRRCCLYAFRVNGEA